MIKGYEMDFILLRLVLPFFLFCVSTIRYNVFSFTYLICLLVCPLLKRADDKKSYTKILIFLIWLITVSSLYSLAHPFMNLLPLIKNYSQLTGCTELANITSQIGVYAFQGIPFYRVLRILLPDPVILVVAVICLVYIRRRQHNIARSAQDNENVVVPAENSQEVVDTEHTVLRVGFVSPTDTSRRKRKANVASSSGDNNSADVASTQTNDNATAIKPGQSDPPTLTTSISNSKTLDLLHRLTRQHHQQYWRAWAIESSGVALTILMTGVAGIMSPSILSSLYLVVFLGVCTYWAYHNKVMSVKFVRLRIFLLIYSALHVAFYYFCQFPVSQYLFPGGSFASRFLGLYYIVQSDCHEPAAIFFNPKVRVIDIVAPPVILLLYYVLAIETRRYMDNPPRMTGSSLIRQGHSTNRRMSRDPERQVLTSEAHEQTERLITNSDPAAVAVSSNYNSLSEHPANVPRLNSDQSEEIADREVQTTNVDASLEETRGETERPLILSLLNTAIRNSYILSFIVMMAWSVTYRSWLSFMLLLSGCLLWIIPRSRVFCLYFSPLIVAYAICLVLLQFIYGLNLENELPQTLNTKSGTSINLAEIGLQKSNNPTGPLAVQIGFLIVFWLTLRLFIMERSMTPVTKRPRPDRQVELSAIPESTEEASNFDNIVQLGTVDNKLYRDFTKYVRRLCEKYWILVCCLSMLLVSTQQPVVIFRVVYMVLLLYFLLVFQLSYNFWRKQMLVFWWLVILYSMTVLISVYVYQFEEFPKNITSKYEEILQDIGLEKFESTALFQRLVSPTVFIVVIILQVHYFHTPFLKETDMDKNIHNRHNNHEHTHRHTIQAVGEIGSTRSVVSKVTAASEYSDFMDDVNSAFQSLVNNIKLLVDKTYNITWRFFEVHWCKIVTLVLAITVFNEVSAANFLHLAVMVICLPFPATYPFFYIINFLWSTGQILFKMIYQLNIVSDSWVTNCTASHSRVLNNYSRVLSNQSNTKYIGLEKVTDGRSFQSYIINHAVLMAVSVMGYAIRYHQQQYYKSFRHGKPMKGIIFPEVRYDTVDDSLLNFVKFLFNYSFYKCGLELSFCVSVICACLRMDAFSIVYLLLALIFLFSSRDFCYKLWLPYCCLLGFLLPLQYAASLGLPPGLCYEYPWTQSILSDTTLERLFQWLSMPSYEKPPLAQKLMADMFQYLFVSLQFQVFRIEHSNDAESFGGGNNQPVLINDMPTDMDKDFINNKNSYMDYLKHAVFYWSYWVSLATVFITGVNWITLFCLGYIIISFIYLWMGQNVMLRRRKNLIASWNFIIGYNFFVIFSKACLQLMGCVYLDVLLKGKTKSCWIFQLLGAQCLNPMEWNIYDNTNKDKYSCTLVSSGLHWDVICFIIIIFQRKVFMTRSFANVVLDLNVQSKFASRGAYLINRKLMQDIQFQNEHEKDCLEKVQVKMNELLRRQEKLGKNIPYITEHYMLIRSGAEYMFEDEESEDSDIEGDVVVVADRGKNDRDSNKSFPDEEYQDAVDLRKRPGSATRPDDLPLTTHEEEDDENPVSTPNSRMNPLQVINTAMEKGARNCIRQFRRSVSEVPTAPSTRRASMQNPKLESMSRLPSTSKSHLQSENEEDEVDADEDAPPNTTRSSYVLSNSAQITDSKQTSPEHKAHHGASDPTSVSAVNLYLDQPELDPSVRDAALRGYSDPLAAKMPQKDTCDGDGEEIGPFISPPECDTILVEAEESQQRGSSEGCWSKFKSMIMICIIFISSSTDSLNIFLNKLTRDYRRIRRKIDQEKLLVKKRVLEQIKTVDENTQHPGSSYSSQLGEQLDQIVHDIVSDRNHNADSDIQRELERIGLEDKDKRQEFKKSRSRFFLLGIAFGNIAIVYSELICYFLLILNHMCSGNCLTLPYPLMVFLWGMLSVPRPSKSFWITLITYTEIVIVVKYIFQFEFIKFHSVNMIEDPQRIIGIEKKEDYAVYDLIQLLFIFLHRGYLKNNGLWRDHTEFAEDLEKVAKENNDNNTIKRPTKDEKLITPMTNYRTSNPLTKMKRFYNKMTDPRFNKKVDIYVFMFLCEFIAFLIIIFGYVSFGPSTGSEDNAFQFIKTNKIPVPFISMVICQFILIIIDRALFLRKHVLAKFVFQIIHVLLIHLWLFFLLPQITKNTFVNNLAPQLLYFVKCIYFALSAYQMRSGYPKRILGNFLAKDYNYINMILFKGYMIVPFLYELRNVMDWMWTDTSLALYHWMELEDVHAKIFILKCWRRSELEYPTPRAALKSPNIKYLVGGLLLAFIFICFWGPLTVSAFIGTTFIENPPKECTFSMSIGGYPNIFSFTSRDTNIMAGNDKLLECLQKKYSSNTTATGFLKTFLGSDIRNITMDGSSGSLWAITPPSMENMMKQLNSDKSTMLNFQMKCRREQQSKTFSQTAEYIENRHLTEDEKITLVSILNSTCEHNASTEIHLKDVFSRILLGAKKNLEKPYPARLNIMVGVNASLKCEGNNSMRWWELREARLQDDDIGEECGNEGGISPNPDAKLSILTFNERVSDNYFIDLYSSYGILGLYATYIFVAHRLLRVLYSDTSYIIRYEEMPHVDRVLDLVHDIYLVRESKHMDLEEQLFAKLIYFYRSSETMIKWTRHRKKNIRKHSRPKSEAATESLSRQSSQYHVAPTS